MSFVNGKPGGARIIRAALALLVAPMVGAQTQTNQATQAKNINYSNQPFTRPVKTGTTQPATCTLGDLFFNTAAPAGQNLYACVALNTWALETGGGTAGAAGASGDLQRNSAGALAAANLNQNGDGSLNASAAVTEPAPYTPAYNVGGTTTCDLSKSTTCRLNANGATTLAVTNPHGSGPYTFLTVTDASGPYTISLPGAFVGAPPFSPAASSTFAVTCVFDGSANYTCGYTEAPSVIRMTTERTLPGTPASGSACVPDSSGHMLRCINSSGTTFAVAKEMSGIRKGNGSDSVDTAAAAADVIGLFSGCSGTLYLGADGACHAAGGGGGGSTNTTPWILPFGAADNGSTAVLPQNGAMLVTAVTLGNSTQIGKILLSVGASGKHGAWAIYSIDGNTRLATGTAATLCGGCGQVFSISYTAAAGTYYFALSTDDNASGTYDKTSANFGTGLSGSPSTPLTATAANTVTWSAGSATWPATLGALTPVANAPIIAVTY